jgi:hypothetical protein
MDPQGVGQALDQTRVIDLGYLHHAFEHRKAFADPFCLTAQAGFFTSLLGDAGDESARRVRCERLS